MQLYDNLTSIRLEHETMLAIGAFDGVHIGHQHLIARVAHRVAGR